MICLNTIQKYCCDDICLIENYDKAINDKNQTWHCHHRLETDLNMSRKKLIDIGRYYNVPASELIFLTAYEHNYIHKNSEYYKILSKSMKGKNNPCYGRTGSKHPLYGVHRHRVYDNEEHTKYHYEI